MAKTRDFSEVIRRRLASQPRLRLAVERERLGSLVAGLIFDARTDAGLTQGELAELIGTRQSVIARLEDADYGAHSLSMLTRIATALGRRLTVNFESLRRQKRAPTR